MLDAVAATERVPSSKTRDEERRAISFAAVLIYRYTRQPAK